jgi:hypothetical protein
VVAVTAVAAFLPIRHVRNTNEITVYLRLSDRLESLGLAGAFTMIDPLLKRLATDPALRLRLVASLKKSPSSSPFCVSSNRLTRALGGRVESAGKDKNC